LNGQLRGSEQSWKGAAGKKERPQAKHPEHEIEEASQRGWFFLWSLTEFGDEGERSSPRRPGE
jgi:hypothetical protein